MPVMDGFEASRLIRQLPQGKELPIIALSAAAMVHDKQASEEAGMNEHIPKPINQEQLIAVLLKYIKATLTPSRPEADGEPTIPGRSSGSFPKTVAGFNVAEALARLNNNEVLLSKLLLGFASDFAAASRQIEDMLAKDKKEEARQLLHTIKGVSANLGADTLSKAAKTLEDDIDSGQSIQASYLAFREQLEGAVLAVQRNIRPVGEGGLTSEAGDQELIESHLERLLASLERNELLSDEELSRILDCMATRVSAPLLVELKRHIHDFDFEAAVKTLAKIMTRVKIK